ncbi:MAG: DNA polymerase III subunit gamma/tau [Gammaproteobacteria bacterium]|nr:DNA polymerase III subunit gamma/tau [Gammaproteobacteria bacterium]
MSYEVLARKWRPANFEELVGQEHVQRALVNGLDEDRLHHAYLFTGTRGVGKTTIARIFAKSLNCETGVTSTPCGTCTSCREIAEGRFVDLIEVDAASRTGVDDTRELLENVQYAPSRGRYKVYLIDEVHMFSKHSFNALLKTLEEPPPHVKFLLATTDPQKLPVTILSRCLQFNLKRLPISLIVSHLQHILDAEKVEYDLVALQLLAEGADGSMRDGLSLLDQALAFGAGAIREQEARDMLGTVSRDRVLNILKALLSRDAKAVIAEVAALAEFTPDYEGVLAELLSLLHHMMLAKTVPEALDEYVSDREALLVLSEQVSAEDLQLFYQIGLIGRRDLPLAPSERGGFEMVLLRMLAFRPAQPSTKVSAQASSRVNSAAAGYQKADAAKPAVREEPAPAQSASQPKAPPAVNQQADVKAVTQDWRQILEGLSVSGMVKQLAANCQLLQQDGNTIRLGLDPRCKQLLSPKAEKRLQQALGEYFDADIRLEIETSTDDSRETPAQAEAREKNERQQQAEKSIEEDGFVQAMKETFNAEVIPGSVRPTAEDN